MTEEQIDILKFYIGAAIAHAMCPVSHNEHCLLKAEELLDKALLSPTSGTAAGDGREEAVGGAPVGSSQRVEGRHNI